MNERLAIVIPAYKYQFLSQSIESIANQTARNFNLYIGDDASPYDLESIIEPFRKQIQIKYKKFEENLGLVSLTRQWSRCIDLSESEEFIWLFSDDDIMPPDAVERFYAALENNENHDLYRFNLQFINEDNFVIRKAGPHPVLESSKGFLIRRLTFSTISAACEYIFRRKVYNENFGFVGFPLAWCSDDATWALFGRQNGIFTISGSPVSMRMSSGLNISSDIRNNDLKFSAIVSFVKWANVKFKNDIDKQYYYLYLRSQINALSVSLKQRLAFSGSLLFFLNPVLLMALIVNRSIIYKTVDALFNIENKLLRSNNLPTS
jgi:glycosyltransferase involved in cell wall biosynthesis